MGSEPVHMLVALFVGFLLGAAIAWRATSVAVRLTIASCLPSLIRELATSGVEQSITSALSRLGFAATLSVEATSPTGPSETSPSPSSGSSSGSDAESLTSTSSPRTDSTRIGLLERGMKLSEAAILATDPQELASKPSVPAETERSLTLESTQGSKNKRRCRLCSKIRALVGGGES